jgi:hypothetical protein
LAYDVFVVIIRRMLPNYTEMGKILKNGRAFGPVIFFIDIAGVFDYNGSSIKTAYREDSVRLGAWRIEKITRFDIFHHNI